MAVFSGVGSSAEAADGDASPLAEALGSTLGAALGAVVAAPGLLHAAIRIAVANMPRVRESLAMTGWSSSFGRRVPSRWERADRNVVEVFDIVYNLTPHCAIPRRVPA
jgi:hypothetical protein